MKKSLWKRVLALVLCLALSAGYLPVPSFAEDTEEPVALQQEEPVEEVEEPEEETEAPTTEPTTEPTEAAEGSAEAPVEELHQEEPDQAVAALQALIDALPEEVTEDNAEIVAAQLETILEGLEALTEDQLAQLDLTRYQSALAALDALTGGLQEAETLEEETMVAEVTIGGNITQYATLQGAFDAVKGCTAADKATIKLLDDVTVNEEVAISGGVFTLTSADTESKTLYANSYFEIYGGTVTLGSNVTIQGTIIEVPWNAEDATVVAVDGAVIAQLSVVKGTLEMKDGKVFDLSFPSGSGMMKYTGGTVGELRVDHGDFRIPANTNRYEKISVLSGATLSGLLGEGCAYQDSDGKYLVRNELSGKELTNVAVVQCTHSDSTGSGWESGTCKFCGTVCQHTWTDGTCTTCGEKCTHQWDGNGLCSNCKLQAAAKIGETFYATLEEAINAAGNDATVTLLMNVSTEEWLMIKQKGLTLDLNGKTLNCFALNLSAKVTVIDGSAGADGKVEVVMGTSSNELTVKGGTVDRINLVNNVTVAGGTVRTFENTTSVTISDGRIESVELNPAGTLTVNGGTVESVTLDRDSQTLTNNGGTVKNVILTAGTLRRTLSGGPFDKVQITSASALDSIDLTQFAPDGYMFLFTDGKLVRAGDIEHTQENGKHIYTISGPVKVEAHSHSYDETTHKCSCGEYNVEAKIDGTFYDTLEEAIAAVQSGQTITLLAEVAETVTSDAGITLTLDLSGKTLAGLELTGSMNLTLTGGGTVQSVTLSGGGTLELDDATVEFLTIDCRTAAPKLIGKPFNKVRIVASKEMTAEELETAFSPDGYELHVKPSGYSAWWKLSSLSRMISRDGSQDGYVYDISTPVYSHIHSAEPGEEYDFVCPGCGAEVRAKVGDRYYVFNERAIAAAADGTTLVVMSGAFSTNLNNMSGTFEIDLNGYNIGSVVAHNGQTVTIRNSKFAKTGTVAAVNSVSAFDPNYTGNVPFIIEEGVTVQRFNSYGVRITVNGGSIETMFQSNDEALNVQVNSGKVDCVKIKGLNAKLSGGPFNQVVLRDITDPASIDPSQLVPEGGKLLYTEDYRAVTADDFKAGTDGCVLTGPVEGHIVHDFDPDTGLCDCGELAGVARIGTIFYDTLKEAFENAQDGDTIVLLADNTERIDISKEPGSITLDLNGKAFFYLGFEEIQLIVQDSQDSPGIAPRGEIHLVTTRTPDLQGTVSIKSGKIKTVGSAGAGAVAQINGGEVAELVIYGGAIAEVTGGKVTERVWLQSNSEITVSGGTVQKVVISDGTVTATGQGAVESVIFDESTGTKKISGGPFQALQIWSNKALTVDNIDLAQYVPDGAILMFPGYQKVTTGNIEAKGYDDQNWRYVYTITGPVEGHIHAYNDTGKCPCGYQAEAKFNGNFYATLAEAVQALQEAEGGTIVLLKNLDTIQMDQLIPESGYYVPILDLNGHTVGTLVANKSVIVESNAQGSAKISSIQISADSGVGVYQNVTVENVTLEEGHIANYSGTVKKVTIIKSSKETRLYKGPFEEVSIQSDIELTTLDLHDFVALDDYFYYKDSGKPVSAADVLKNKSEEGDRYIYTMEGPVMIQAHTTHDFDKDTGLCPCGVQAAAKVGNTVYETFEEALEVFNNSGSQPHLYLLKDVDLSGKTLSFTGNDDYIYWNGHTLTVDTLNIQKNIEMSDETGTGGVKGSVWADGIHWLVIHNGTYSGLSVGNGCTINGGTYAWLTIRSDCISVTINGGTFSTMSALGSRQIIIPSGKMFYKDGRVWTESLDGQMFNLTLKDHDPHTPDENGDCICGLSFEASVTEGDKTIYYATLQEAVTAASETSGTVKLVCNLENVTISSGTFTLDWNGHNVTALTVTGGTVTLTGTGGVTGTAEKALDIQGGTVTIQSGSYNNVNVEEAASVTVAGGSFYGKDGQKPITAADMSKVQFAVGKLVKESYYRKLRPYDGFGTGSTLTVEDCTEHFATSGDTCYYCATELEARVEADGTTVYIGTFTEALAKAQETTNSTLTLLKDTECEMSTVSKGSFTIDWNGHTLLQKGVFLIKGGSVTMQTSVEPGGLSENGSNILLTNGALTIKSGSYLRLVANDASTLDIQGGTFFTKTGDQEEPPLSIGSDVTVKTPNYYVFYDQDENVVSNWKTNGFARGSTVTLKYHENHTPDETGHCICGLGGAAVLKVTDYWGNFTETPYNDFSALKAAAEANNTDVRLTLWMDVRLDTAESIGSDSYSFTLDWNGKKVVGEGSFAINSTNPITLTDSQSGGGMEVPLTINGKVTLEGGRYKAPIILGENAEITLPLEKAFHDENNKVITQADALALQDGYVTVASHDHKISGCECGRGVAAVITVNGQDTPYSTLAEAVENIQSGCTLKLMSDGTLERDPDTWDFTLDLGGCTLDAQERGTLYPNYLQTLVIQDSVSGGVLKTQEISLDYSGSLVLKSGTVEGNLYASYGGGTMTISGGTVTGTVDPYMGNLTVTGGTIGTLGRAYATAKITLHGGTYGKLEDCDRYMLEDGYALYDAEGNVVNIGKPDIQNVTIQAHTHDYTGANGICPCGGVNSGEGLDLILTDAQYEVLNAAQNDYPSNLYLNGETGMLSDRNWSGKHVYTAQDGSSLKNAILQTYTWAYNANNDAYPTGMKVYRVVEVDHHLELKEERALEDLLEYKGASIRCEGDPGVRIITGMTKANKAALTGAGLDGYKLLEYGTVIAWANEMNGDSSLVLGKSYSRFGYAYNLAQNKDKVFDFTETGILYTNVLVNFAMSRCGSSVILRSFAVLEKDGVRFTIYGGQVDRTISGIAQQVLADTTVSLNDTERAYVQSLVDAGKGNSNG